MTTDPRGGPTPDPFTCPACASKDVRCNAGPTTHVHTCRRCTWNWNLPTPRRPNTKGRRT